jgi:hypothetical protein
MRKWFTCGLIYSHTEINIYKQKLIFTGNIEMRKPCSSEEEAKPVTTLQNPVPNRDAVTSVLTSAETSTEKSPPPQASVLHDNPRALPPIPRESLFTPGTPPDTRESLLTTGIKI